VLNHKYETGRKVYDRLIINRVGIGEGMRRREKEEIEQVGDVIAAYDM
jgi:hypothetical protein